MSTLSEVLIEKQTVETVCKLGAAQFIEALKEFDKACREEGFQNEQWFLDFQDELNEISVR